MCQPKPGTRCPHDAECDAQPTRHAYTAAHPDGPSLDPLTAASPILTLTGHAPTIPHPHGHITAPDGATTAWAAVLARGDQDERTQQTIGRQVVADVSTWAGKPLDDDERAFLASASKAEFLAATFETRKALQANPKRNDNAATDRYLEELMKARIAGEYAAQLGYSSREGAHEWQPLGSDQYFCMNCHVTAERTGDPRFVWPCEPS